MKQPTTQEQQKKPQQKNHNQKEEHKDSIIIHCRRHSWFPYIITSLAVCLSISFHGNVSITFLGKPRNISTKPYTNWISFHEYYLQEHRDPICRILHFIGTSIVIFMTITNYPYIIKHTSIGIACGLFLCEYLSPLSNGIIEFISIFVITGLSCDVFGRSHNNKFPWQLLIMGYLPAWIGHTFFEHNRPATFIYPTYSLLSDFRMWYQMLKGDLSWK